METIEQIAAIVPYGTSTLHKAEDIYGYSKSKTLQIYSRTRNTVTQTRNDYLQFRKNLQKTAVNIIQQTFNEVLMRLQNVVRVKKNQKTPQDMEHARERIQALFQTIMTQYILKNRVLNNKKLDMLVKAGKKYSIRYIVPMYLNLRATMIVTKQMLIEFIESSFNDVKLTYQSGKDTVVMFVSGNFNEQNISKKVFEGIGAFRKFTIQVVNKGLQIKVDRKSLVQNYDKFAVNFLEVIKQMKEKSQNNIEQVKKRSKNLYKQVIKRIRAKQLQLRCQLKQQMPYLLQKPQ